MKEPDEVGPLRPGWSYEPHGCYYWRQGDVEVSANRAPEPRGFIGRIENLGTAAIRVCFRRAAEDPDASPILGQCWGGAPGEFESIVEGEAVEIPPPDAASILPHHRLSFVLHPTLVSTYDRAHYRIVVATEQGESTWPFEFEVVPGEFESEVDWEIVAFVALLPLLPLFGLIYAIGGGK